MIIRTAFLICMFTVFAHRAAHLAHLTRRLLFGKEDPHKAYKKMLEYLRKQKEERAKGGDPIDPKYLIGAGIYLSVCVGLYELKRERAIVITHEEVLGAVKKSQTNAIYVVKEKPEKGEKKDEEGRVGVRSNFRKVYLKIDGVDHVSYVPEIELFYQRIREIEKNKTTQRAKIIEKEEETFDEKFKRFFTAINKVILPLLFPILLFNSSVGKVFKTKVLGQTEGFRPDIKFKDIAGLGNAKIEIS